MTGIVIRRRGSEIQAKNMSPARLVKHLQNKLFLVHVHVNEIFEVVGLDNVNLIHTQFRECGDSRLLLYNGTLNKIKSIVDEL